MSLDFLSDIADDYTSYYFKGIHYFVLEFAYGYFFEITDYELYADELDDIQLFRTFEGAQTEAMRVIVDIVNNPSAHT